LDQGTLIGSHLKIISFQVPAFGSKDRLHFEGHDLLPRLYERFDISIFDGVHNSAAAWVPNSVETIEGMSERILSYSLIKVGSFSITPLFLIKTALFLFVLIGVSKIMKRVLLGRVFSHLHIAEAQKFALGRFATYLFFFGGLFIGLQSLGLNLSSLLVFGGAIGVGVGLGLQNVVSNFVAGLVLLVEQPIRIGDRIVTGDTMGDVIRIAARSTWIRTNENVVVIIPNNDFINNPVVNWTANDDSVRINILVGVGYSSDPQKVRELLLQVATENPNVLEDPKSDVIFTGYGDNSLNFSLRVWTSQRAHTPAMLKSDIYFTLFRLFSDNGIELPFPQRDLHLRSSDISIPFVAEPPAKKSSK
jgi:small-conductance mechanosensitive channel